MLVGRFASSRSHLEDVLELYDPVSHRALAQQTAEMLNSFFEGREPIRRKIVTTCPHCMNTLGREYPQLETMIPSFGGTSFWVKGRAGLDSEELAKAAAQKGILIEPGRINFGGPHAPRNYFRLAFSSIEEKKIEPGIKLLAETIAVG